ncbi:hypothetical protein NE664_08495 [Anaerotignum faecicola]|nr:hypothetical protein [Anaerotignum faecicola]
MGTKNNGSKKAAVKESEKLSPNDLVDEPDREIRQFSQYTASGQAAPLNDVFFEGKSNPLSSKGN